MHLIRLSLLLLLASSSASVQHPPPMSMSGCASSLAALYPCLWYLATPPEYSPPTPSLACCATFFQALSTAGPKCVCHVVQQPLVLGYTIDTGKLIDLFPVCGLRDSVFALRWFHHACQAARNEILSPATGIAPAPGPANVANPNSAARNEILSPVTGIAPGPANVANPNSDGALHGSRRICCIYC